MLQYLWLKIHKRDKKEEGKICGLEESSKDWEAMYSNSRQGICYLDPPALALMSKLWNTASQRTLNFGTSTQMKKITTIFCCCLFVCKMPFKLYIYFILCMLIYLVFNNLTIIFQVPRLLLWQYPGLPHIPTIWLNATLPCGQYETALTHL